MEKLLEHGLPPEHHNEAAGELLTQRFHRFSLYKTFQTFLLLLLSLFQAAKHTAGKHSKYLDVFAFLCSS